MQLDPDHPIINTLEPCGGTGEHTLRIITDGAYFYAYVTDSTTEGGTEVGAACMVHEGHGEGSGEGRVLEAACPGHGWRGEGCTGYVQVKLDTGWDHNPAWTTAGADPEAAAALSDYGTLVES